ncbi:unnamed protein product [Calypogeia fissa]
MQTQLLCSSSFPSTASASSQHEVAKCELSKTVLSKNGLELAKKRSFTSLWMRKSRSGLPAMRIVTESPVDESRNSVAESAASGMNVNDLEAPDESLQQQQQLLSSSAAAAPYPPATFRELSFTDRHLLVLGFVACVTTGALSCVLLAAIPTLIAMKRAAESLGKLADTAREELPGTMAAVRLSGMEISDLTMELSDLGQEISAGVRNSSRAVRAAEDGLRRIGNFTSVAVLQERVNGQVEVARPAVARAARSTREALMRARSLVHSLITLARLSSWLGWFFRFISPLRRKAISS